ncbi:MAG TPA: glycoside hydrolase family 44 protein [Patescibacteria group bacterium]|nr:glycoside hydrolase family 44 protein [Patescibacteria group bacterium]
MALGLCTAGTVQAQIPITISIDTQKDTARISPYIYGSNAHSHDKPQGVAARRLGGNRMTGYNWETNASHAGNDYHHQNDNYLPWYMGIPNGDEPGIVMTAFHDTSLAQNSYTLLTLQAAGYVSADKGGPVAQSATAPSNRFKEVRFKKNAPFVMQPDLTDNYVYMDELVNFLVSKYGASHTATGVNGYAIDNEPGLWYSTHPRIHPQKVRVAELLSRTVELSRAVKAVDPSAEIFGGVMYGFSEFYNLQEAPDWDNYKDKGRYYDVLLDHMRKASEADGKRLMDVLAVHWYSEAQGTNAAGQKVRIIFNDDASEGVARARMQAPRSLWDSTYQEDSWIGQWFSPIALIPALQASVNKNYPGTKLAFTEYNYGGENHISGGIALADQFGIFGKYGVYMSNMWGEIKGYNSAAFKIYRNYDGNFSTFGDMNVFARTSDNENSSVYAATKGDSALHIILINKHFTQPLNASISIAAPGQFTTGRVWTFDATSPQIRQLAPITSVQNNMLQYSVQPLSVTHIILRKSTPTSVAATEVISEFLKAENSDNGSVRLSYSAGAPTTLAVYNMAGELLKEWPEMGISGNMEWNGETNNGATAANGTYIFTMRTPRGIQTAKAILVK